jgi:hypothetical protein
MEKEKAKLEHHIAIVKNHIEKMTKCVDKHHRRLMVSGEIH